MSPLGLCNFFIFYIFFYLYLKQILLNIDIYINNMYTM